MFLRRCSSIVVGDVAILPHGALTLRSICGEISTGAHVADACRSASTIDTCGCGTKSMGGGRWGGSRWPSSPFTTAFRFPLDVLGDITQEVVTSAAAA